MRKNFAKNSFSGVIQFLITALLTFITIPIFIKTLGTQSYGIFAVLSIFGSLQVFTDLGLTTSLIKYIAEQGKGAESNYDIAVTLLLVLFVSLFLTIALVVFRSFILTQVLRIPTDKLWEAKWLYLFLLSGNFFLFVGQVFKAVIDAEEHIYITNYIYMLYGLINWGLILTVLILGYNLIMVGLVSLFSALTWFNLMWIMAVKVWGQFTIRGLSTNFTRIVKKQLSYAIKLYVSYLINFFYEPLSIILISNLIGVREAGFFDIALRVKRQIVTPINKVLYPLYPIIPKLSDLSKTRFLISDTEQKTFFLVIPVVSIIVFTGKPFIRLWIGENIEPISIAMISITSAFLLFNETVVPNYFFLIGKGYASKNIILQLSLVCFNAFFILIFYERIGYYAAVLGNVGAIFVYFLLSVYFQKKYLNSLFFETTKQILQFLLSLFLCLLSGYSLLVILNSDSLTLIVLPVVVCITAILCFRYLKVFSLEDIERYLGFSDFIATKAARLLKLGKLA